MFFLFRLLNNSTDSSVAGENVMRSLNNTAVYTSQPSIRQDDAHSAFTSRTNDGHAMFGSTALAMGALSMEIVALTEALKAYLIAQRDLSPYSKTILIVLTD
jgi:hypothetical protein